MTSDLLIPEGRPKHTSAQPPMAAKIDFCQTKPFSPRCAILGGNSFGLLAPITGYLVEGDWQLQPRLCVRAGALALAGATVALALARTPIGEVRAPTVAQLTLAD